MRRIRIIDGPTSAEIVSAEKGKKMVFKGNGEDLEVGFIDATGSTGTPENTGNIGLSIKVMLDGQVCNGHYNHQSRKGWLDCPAVATVS